MYRAIPRPQPVRPKSRRNLFFVPAIVLGLFIVANLALLAVYSNKTYPNAKVAGQPFGNVPYAAAADRLSSLPLLPRMVQVDYGNGRQPVATADLGVKVDYETVQTAIRQRHWLPVANFIQPTNTPLVLDTDEAKLQRQLGNWAKAIASQPVDARIEQQLGRFQLINQQNGKRLDTGQARNTLLTAIGSGSGGTVTIKPLQQEPPVTDAKLASQVKTLKTAEGLSLQYSYGNNKQAAQKADIVSWYRKDGANYTPAVAEIKAFLAGLASQWQIKLSNTDAAVAATRQALDSGQPLDFKLQGSAYAAPRTLTYCTAVRGVDAAQLTELNRKLAVTFADERGWSLGGAVRYVRGAAGCDFTVWLSSANQMPTFGAICDPEWSCHVAPNVVINYDRWIGASETWNAAGGNLNDYDSMVINHETGHWHGYDHVGCPGAGQLAPVMQQQSINLQGCRFSPWPNAEEQAVLRSKLGL